ncbi:MAG: hypothetical protein GXX89_08120 [Clostridiales bacterium]|mgnify:CR=1 FL=1|jgi:hypothetical protein|nr:hypothetical protein [Clostridiales bacterium]
MKKITSKLIVDNLSDMMSGKRVSRCGVDYWLSEKKENGEYDIYKQDTKKSDTGVVYGKVIDGVPYQL